MGNKLFLLVLLLFPPPPTAPVRKSKGPLALRAAGRGWAGVGSKTERKRKRRGRDFFPSSFRYFFPLSIAAEQEKGGRKTRFIECEKMFRVPPSFLRPCFHIGFCAKKTVGAIEQARTYVPDSFLWRDGRRRKAQIRREKVAQRVRERNRRRSIATKGPPPIACQKGRKSRRSWRAFSSLIQEWKESNDTFLFLFVVVVHTSVLLLSRRESWNEVEWKEEEACAACLVGRHGSWH